MKYYVEEEMRDLRLALEEQVLPWPQVKATKLFGCPCYRGNGVIFVFLFMDGIVITRLSDMEKMEISGKRTTMPFEASNRKIPAWLRIPIRNIDELVTIMPYVKKSYESALKAMKK